MKPTTIAMIFILIIAIVGVGLSEEIKYTPISFTPTIQLEKPTQLTDSKTVESIGDYSKVIVSSSYQRFTSKDIYIETYPYIDLKQLAELSADTKDSSNKLKYTTQNATFQYEYTDLKLKENIVVYSEPNIQWNYILSENAELKQINNNIYITNKQTQVNVIQLDQPYIIGSDLKRTNLSYNINGNYIQLVGDFSKVQYPAVIDPTFIALPAPTTYMSTGVSYSFRFSNDTQYAVLGTRDAPYYYLYRFNNSSSSNWTVLPALKTPPTSYVMCARFSNDSELMFLYQYQANPMILIYRKNTTDTSNWTLLPSPSTIPTTPSDYGSKMDVSSDGKYMTLVSYITPYVWNYKRDTTAANWTKLTNPYTLPINSLYAVAISNDTKYMAVGGTNPGGQNFKIYIKDLSTPEWYSQANVATYPTGDVWEVGFSKTCDYLFAFSTSGVTRYISIYKKNLTDRSNWTIATTLEEPPYNAVNAIDFARNDEYMALGSGSGTGVAGLTLYKKNLSVASNWSKYLDFFLEETSSVNSIHFSNNTGYLGLSLGIPPGIRVYSFRNTTPVVSFTTNTTGGTTPLAVMFNDTSTETPTSWNWIFNNVTPGNETDVSFSTSMNVTQVFRIGNYSIKHSATNSNGTGWSNTTWINVSNILPPTSSFTTNVTSGLAPTGVMFNDTSTGNPTAWNWIFNNITPGNATDVSFATTMNTTKTFGVGNFSIKHNATNSAGVSWYNLTWINITAPAAPVISFTANNTNGNAPLVVQFNDTSTNFPTSWLWTFGDDTTSTSQNPLHTYTNTGTYTVTLNASNIYTYGTELTKLNYITATNPMSSGAGAYYPPHTVKFIVKDRYGRTIPNILVTATTQETTMGSWDWLNKIWGISDTTNIQTSTLQGSTGYDGGISFVMMETIGYSMQFTNATLGISYNVVIYPQEQEILITIKNYPTLDLKITDYVNYSITEYINTNKSVTVTGNYVDISGYTTSTTFFVNFTNNTPIYSSKITGSVNNTFQYLIPYTANTSYNYGFNASTTPWGYIGQNKVYSSPNFLDLEIPTEYYSWISAAILLLFCAIFSRGNNIFGVIIVPAMASFLVYIGWMPITMGVASSILLVLGVLIYMKAKGAE